MLKGILVALDGSDDGCAALELGLRWARRFGAQLTGLSVVDEPRFGTSGMALFGGGHYWHGPSLSPLVYDARRAAGLVLEQFARRCSEEGVACRALEETGTPFVEILAEAQRHDLVMIGRRSRFEQGSVEEPDETLGRVLEESPRPVVAVPAGPAEGVPVVVAYDGSPQSARALYAFEASGLGEGRRVHVVAVGPDFKDAAGHADGAVGFLRLHGIEAAPHPVETTMTVPEAILSKVRYLDAGLLVMGACGRPALRESFLGSTTRTVLEQCPVPVFCYR